MNVANEDKKLHDDGIFNSFMGYKEWVHYLGTFTVNGDILTFMLGFVGSHPGWGVLGWISYKGKQYSLDGNIEDKDNNGFYEINTRAQISSDATGYRIVYPKTPSPDNQYRGQVTGVFPQYMITVKTPEVDVEVTMEVNSIHSIYQRELHPWIHGGWFHSGDISAALKGTIGGHAITSVSNKGWYEKNWSKIPIFWPSEWFWFMSHLDNGSVFNLLIETSLGIRVPLLDECWLYLEGTFHEFPDYDAWFPEPLKKAIQRKDYTDLIGKYITCEGYNKNKGKNDSFELTAVITDFRQYEFRDSYADIKWTNFLFETEGEAVIEGTSIDMKGRGKSERAPIKHWWL